MVSCVSSVLLIAKYVNEKIVLRCAFLSVAKCSSMT